MGWVTGFEPATLGATNRCSNQLSYTHQNKNSGFHSAKYNLKMVGVRGLEPPAPWSQTKYSNHTELHPVNWSEIIYKIFYNVKSF